MQNAARRKASALLLDTFWPNRCDCCEERIPYDLLICPECEALLQAQRITYTDWATHHSTMPWDGGAVLFSYEKAAKTGILAVKDGHRGFAEYAGVLLAEELKSCCPPEQISCITWVPVTKRRKRQQGYAHTELLARAAAAALGRPLRSDLLAEHAGKIRQHDLPAAERKKYAERFTATDRRTDGLSIVLVDDILTTGNTLRRCTEELRRQGAARVWIAAVCATIHPDRAASAGTDCL
ncbi:MAG: ComF family protein [Oscillospiraceae bacterium]|nr:ComF family protein [Oscillospiraceae bacterium]